jgi:hypothetical protein
LIQSDDVEMSAPRFFVIPGEDPGSKEQLLFQTEASESSKWNF